MLLCSKWFRYPVRNFSHVIFAGLIGLTCVLRMLHKVVGVFTLHTKFKVLI